MVTLSVFRGGNVELQRVCSREPVQQMIDFSASWLRYDSGTVLIEVTLLLGIKLISCMMFRLSVHGIPATTLLITSGPTLLIVALARNVQVPLDGQISNMYTVHTKLCSDSALIFNKAFPGRPLSTDLSNHRIRTPSCLASKKNKRIVLFDTLLTQVKEDKIRAILGHSRSWSL